MIAIMTNYQNPTKRNTIILNPLPSLNSNSHDCLDDALNKLLTIEGMNIRRPTMITQQHTSFGCKRNIQANIIHRPRVWPELLLELCWNFLGNQRVLVYLSRFRCWTLRILLMLSSSSAVIVTSKTESSRTSIHCVDPSGTFTTTNRFNRS